MNHIQYISDEQNNVTGVIVPIDLWKEIESEKETAYLLKSAAMKKRLMDAKNRTPIPLKINSCVSTGDISLTYP